MVPAELPHPAGWVVDGTDPGTLRPAGPGEVSGRVRAPAAGSYDLWAEGSFGRGIDVFVNGRRVGEAELHDGDVVVLGRVVMTYRDIR
jgi:hypothetical protein